MFAIHDACSHFRTAHKGSRSASLYHSKRLSSFDRSGISLRYPSSRNFENVVPDGYRKNLWWVGEKFSPDQLIRCQFSVQCSAISALPAWLGRSVAQLAAPGSILSQPTFFNVDMLCFKAVLNFPDQQERITGKLPGKLPEYQDGALCRAEATSSANSSFQIDQSAHLLGLDITSQMHPILCSEVPIPHTSARAHSICGLDWALKLAIAMWNPTRLAGKSWKIHHEK